MTRCIAPLILWMSFGFPGAGYAQATLHMLSLPASPAEAVPSPWELKVKEGEADYRLESQDGVRAICLTSRSSSFSIQRRAEVNPKKFPFLTWRWLGTELPPNGDLRHGRIDDQAAQLFVLFDGRKAISYVWDSNAPTGTVVNSSIPFLLNLRVVVVESGSARVGKWQEYKRDIQKDYRRLFGGNPPAVKAVRFQINSQHTRSDAGSCIASISFAER